MKIRKKNKDDVKYFSDLEHGDTFFIGKNDDEKLLMIKIEDTFYNAVFLNNGKCTYIQPYQSVHKINSYITIGE